MQHPHLTTHQNCGEIVSFGKNLKETTRKESARYKRFLQFKNSHNMESSDTITNETTKDHNKQFLEANPPADEKGNTARSY